MFGGISIIGWFHTIIGTAGIISGLYLLSRFKFIDIWSSLGKFYLTCTFITSASSLFIYSATGSFNDAHFLSVLTMAAICLALILDKKNLLGFLNIYAKELALSVTVFFSMLPTTAEVLQRLPINDPFVDSIDDPLVLNFYISYVLIYGVFAIYQIVLIKRKVDKT